MKDYLLILRLVSKEFFEDLCSVPLYFVRAFLQISGCLFLVAFVFVSPVFIPLYAFIQWKNKRIARQMLYATHDFIKDYQRGNIFHD